MSGAIPTMPNHETSDFLRVDDTTDELSVVLTGRLDTERCGNIGAPLMDRIKRSGKAVAFDLGAVDFVASAFLRMCIIAARTLGAGKVRLLHANPAIKKVFKIAGLDGYIVIV